MSDSYRTDAPWDREDGHGPVSDWTTRDKRPGEMILSSDGRMKRFYNFAGAVKLARRDGWNTAPYNWPTDGARAHAAALADFEHLRRWCRCTDLMSDSYRTETRTHGTMQFRIDWVHDSDHGAPWVEECGHGEVSDWTTRDKLPGEMILSSDRRMKRFYDFAGAVKLAKKDGWNTAPYNWPTDGARAHAAALADFEYLRRWCNDQWHYCGIVVTLLDADGEPDSVDAALWGIESEGDDYHDEVIGELITECLHQITATIGE